MPENNVIGNDSVAVIARGQAVVEARQSVADGAAVLSVAASAVVRPSEVFAGEARYTGKVRFDCFVTVDGKVECVSTVAEFSDKLTSGLISSGTEGVLDSEIINCEAVIVDGSLKTTAVVNVAMTAAVRGELACITQPEPGIFTDGKTVSYCSVVAELSEPVYVTDGITDVKATEALAVDSRAVVTGAECGAGEVKLSGAVYSTVIVRTEDGLVASYRLVTPFIKVLSDPAIVDGAIARASVCVTDSAATFTSEPDGNRIDIATTLRASATVAVNAQADVATDVFCADNVLEVSSAECELCALEPTVAVFDSVDGQADIGADGGADNVLCVTNASCMISDAAVRDGRVCAEGAVGGDIIYYNAEKNAVSSVAFRLPFAIPLAVRTEAKDVDITATVTDVGVKLRRGSVFDIKAELAFAVACADRMRVTLVTAVKKGEAIEKPDATVIVHIAAEGETLWQAAKALHCSPDRVLEQNDIPAPYKGGERLVNRA